MTVTFLIGALLVFLAMRVPVAISLGLASVLTLLLFGDQSLLSLAQRFNHATEVYPLLAVPFFILAGTFLTSGGVARRLIAFATAITGWIRGGLAMGSVLACMLFAAVSGSSPATVVAVGSITIAGMVSAGYSRAYATGVVTNAGTLGILIPPSIVMVVYGAITETSVGALFIAGVIPGLLLTTAMMTVIYFLARRDNLPKRDATSWREVVRTGREAFWGLLLIAIVLGGIYGGVFTPTEAAAVSAVYALLIAVLVYRDIGPREIPDVLVRGARVTTMLMFIVANAYLFAFVLTTEQIPQEISQAVLAAELPPWAFLILVNVILLVAGNLMDPTSVVLILAPIIFPLAMNLGIDPVHLGIIMVVNMEIGMVTPPVGLNLFVASGVSNLSLTQVIRASLPWLVLLLGFLVVVTYIPAISLFLPELMLNR
ncbi:TRAP transporter large permease [Candidatus Rariloculus sp.]|uniref:TRAP transporter large permease n=1 Tax=Candidatus Rariloculus sp. TaxID=3101265 RepID=UPI003D0D92D3